MLKGLTDRNTATSKVVVTNWTDVSFSYIIEIDNIVIDIHNTRKSGQNLMLLRVRSNTARKAFNLHLKERNPLTVF